MTEVLAYMIHLTECNMLRKQNILLLIIQESAIVNFHYGLIEPDQKILTYVHFRNIVLLEKSMWDFPNEQQREKYSLSP